MKLWLDDRPWKHIQKSWVAPLQTRLPSPVLKRLSVVPVCACGWSQCESVSWKRTPANTADGLREPQDRPAHRDAPVNDQQQPWRWRVWIVRRTTKASTTSTSSTCPCRCRWSTAVERRLIRRRTTRPHRYRGVGVPEHVFPLILWGQCLNNWLTGGRTLFSTLTLAL